jgi:serine/threonine-protein kinase
LAVKVMLQGEPGGVQEERFLEEARITGQLQHPGVAPVHEIGRLADGRPLFAMKLIEGHTLAEFLRARPSPQADLPRFLKIFEQIAQTLAYAHSEGVIHRDLKPSNIMVGAFGEVQVMDWGLARRLRGSGARPRGPLSGGQDPTLAAGVGSGRKTPYPIEPALEGTTQIFNPPEETCAATPPDHQPPDGGRSPDRLTQAGQVMGTPAYMPPEQARGQIDALDERSDVFGLGAILCEILTGQPPTWAVFKRRFSAARSRPICTRRGNGWRIAAPMRN